MQAHTDLTSPIQLRPPEPTAQMIPRDDSSDSILDDSSDEDFSLALATLMNHTPSKDSNLFNKPKADSKKVGGT